MFVGHESTPSVLQCGVLHGSILGPLLFTLYTHLLSTVICLSYHFFTDDSQLHKSGVPSDVPVLVCCLKDCIEDDAEWMGDSNLKMNDDKTPLMAIGTRSKVRQVIPNLIPMSISGCDIPFSQSVRNHGCTCQIRVPHFVLSVAQNWKIPLLPFHRCCQQTYCFSRSLLVRLL